MITGMVEARSQRDTRDQVARGPNTLLIIPSQVERITGVIVCFVVINFMKSAPLKFMF